MKEDDFHIATVKFTYYETNKLGFDKKISKGLRMSAWNEEQMALAPIEFDIGGGGEISPGETGFAELKILKVGNIEKSLFIGSKLLFGAGDRIIGEGIITEIFSRDSSP